MLNKGIYDADDSMSLLVSNHYRMLLVLSRFGIGLGFAEKTIDEVCSDYGVDTQTFLAVTNMLLDDECVPLPAPEICPRSLLAYLYNSHEYFLGFRLPGIRRDLVDVLGDPDDELNRAVIRYFDEYVDQVRSHMRYEEETVFPYVLSRIEGNYCGEYTIDEFSENHDQVEARLTEFKQILIRYYPAEGSNELNSVLFDIFNCENDLASHNLVENRLLVPAIRKLEESWKGNS